MSTPSLLIIEDHTDYRKALRHFLELHHLKVHIIEASTGEEGVLLARTKKPEIVLIDFALGGIDGLQTASQIKKHLPQCNIIILTVYNSKEILRKDADRAIDFFINKSDLYDQFVSVIKNILLNCGKKKQK